MEGRDAQSSQSPMANLSIGDEYKAMLAQVITIHLVPERTLFSVAEVRNRVMMMSIEYSQEPVGRKICLRNLFMAWNSSHTYASSHSFFATYYACMLYTEGRTCDLAS